MQGTPITMDIRHTFVVDWDRKVILHRSAQNLEEALEEEEDRRQPRRGNRVHNGDGREAGDQRSFGGAGGLWSNWQPHCWGNQCGGYTCADGDDDEYGWQPYAQEVVQDHTEDCRGRWVNWWAGGLILVDTWMGAQASTPPWIVIGILPPGGRWRSGPQDPWGRLPQIHPWCHHTHLGRDPSEPPLLPRIRPHGTMLSPSRPVVIIGSTQPPRLACFIWMSRSTSTRGTPVNLVMIHICGQLKD